MWTRTHTGLVLLWFAQPFALIFWLFGCSTMLILGHAAFIEPPVSSEYAGIEVRETRVWSADTVGIMVGSVRRR